MRTVGRLIKIVSVLLLVLGCGYFVSSFVKHYEIIQQRRAGNPFVRTLTGADSSPATYPVRVRLGEVVLDIPRHYFWSLPRHEAPPDNPDQVSFILMAMLPDFKPILTPENRHEFDKPGWNREVMMLVEYSGRRRIGKELFFAIRARLKYPEIADAEFGYRKFTEWRDEYLFRGDENDPENFIRCSKQNDVKSPSCSRELPIGKDIVVGIDFSRNYLDDVHAIENALIDRFNGFRVEGPALEIKP